MFKERHFVNMEKKVFVTVGTTKFDRLIKIVTNNETLKVINKLCYYF